MQEHVPAAGDLSDGRLTPLRHAARTSPADVEGPGSGLCQPARHACAAPKSRRNPKPVGYNILVKYVAFGAVGLIVLLLLSRGGLEFLSSVTQHCWDCRFCYCSP